MSFPRAASAGAGCCTCKRAIARSWKAASTSNPLMVRGSWTAPVASRPFTSTIRSRTDRNDPAATDPEYAFLDYKEPPEPPSSAAESAQNPSESVPWYLQNRPAPTPQQPAIIPDLPSNPPPLLETLLDYVANTAGLDDLVILDLRHLDPPPALGPKLIMIIATARSEKHLHVSADRFCRYLRREHRLRPNAAGLLGRNELKIKLRRKAKRMKILANVGAAEPEGNIDDGIRTGWICCTVGKVDPHPSDTHMPGDNVEGFVGFRDVKPGVNVVVQMFTEEKRNEVDLETLWSGVLKTHLRKDKSAEEILKTSEEDGLEDDTPARQHSEPTTLPGDARAASVPPQSPPMFHRPRPTPGDVFPPASNSETTIQLRKLHGVGLRG